MAMPVGPCKDCEERHLGCHSDCERYKAYREEWERITAEIWKAKKAEALTEGYVITMKRKIARQTGVKKRRK